MFVKLFTQILDSSIADDRRLRHFFTDLLLCANGDGNVVMTVAAIARRIGTTVEEVEWGLEQLQKPDPYSKTPDHQGRRVVKLEDTGYGWHIINFDYYRAMKDSEQLREASRQRLRRFRAKRSPRKATHETQGNVSETQSNEVKRAGNAGNAIQKESKKEKENQRESQNEEESRTGKPDALQPPSNDPSKRHHEITSRIGAVYRDATGETFAYPGRLNSVLKSFLSGWSGTVTEFLDRYRECLDYGTAKFSRHCKDAADPCYLCAHWQAVSAEIAKFKAEASETQTPIFKKAI